MKTHNLIGKITLEEKIHLIKSNKHTNALVIDVPNPLASYYSNFAGIQKPNSIILATKNINSFERILRATKSINSSNQLKLNGAKCEILANGKQFNGIRLKGIESYQDIDRVIDLYIQRGFEFNNSNKVKDQELIRLKVNKFFDLEEVDDFIFRSRRNPDRYYFKMNYSDDYETCKHKIKHVKNNILSNNFDAAHVIFYNQGEINDVVRVIKPNFATQEVQEILKKYHKADAIGKSVQNNRYATI